MGEIFAVAVLVLLFVFSVLVWIFRSSAPKFQQAYDNSEEVIRLILEKQKGEIPYEESGKYLTVSLAVDRHLAGELSSPPGFCIVCGSPATEKKFCDDHLEAGLKVCCQLAKQSV